MSTLSDIKAEIVKRSDEDFSNATYLARAESLFKSNLISIILNDQLQFVKEDYSGLIETVKLVSGTNCVYPNQNNVSNPLPILKLTGAFHYSGNLTGAYKHIQICQNLELFNVMINNPLTRYSETSFVCLSGKKLMIYPYFDNCYIEYIVSATDEIFKKYPDLSECFSYRFLEYAINLASEQFRKEIAGQDQ